MWDKFVITPFDRDRHTHYIKEWLTSRSLDPEKTSDMPEVGFIIFKEEPIAAAFFRQCEGAVGIFDGLISNPKISLFTRHLAIESLIAKIECYAMDHGYKRILAFSVDEGTIKRSIKHGFNKQPHVLISKSL